MKEYKFKAKYERLSIVCDCLLERQNKTPENDIEKLTESLRSELLIRFEKKLVEAKVKYSFTLKAHEAIALKRLLMQDFERGLFELNEIQQVTHELDRSI